MSKSHTTSTGKVLPLRSLTRAEVRRLRTEGLYPVTDANIDRSIDAIHTMVLSESERSEIDSLPWRDGTAHFLEVLKETFGARDEEKNSSPSGPGMPTDGVSPTAANA
jgi:hypothetical protein